MYVIDMLWRVLRGMYGMYQVPVVTLGTRYTLGTSLSAYKDQETKPEVGNGDRHLPLFLLSGQGLGANSRTNRA